MFILRSCAFLFATAAAAAQSSETFSASLEVWHSFDGKEFSYRSTFNPTGQDGLFRLNSNNEGINTIPQALGDSFKALVRANGLYTIRITADLFNATGPFLYASLPVCDLFKSGFREDLVLYLDHSDMRVIGLDYSAAPSPMPRTCDAEKVTLPIVIQSKLKEADAVIAQIVPLIAVGPKPPTLVNVKVPGEEAGNKPAQNQSFLFKYWYIVLPLVVWFLFSEVGAPKDEEAAKAGPAAKK